MPESHWRESEVSIHAPREGCDSSAEGLIPDSEKFQFTHPGRGATEGEWSPLADETFQFTHPGRGATRKMIVIIR